MEAGADGVQPSVPPVPPKKGASPSADTSTSEEPTVGDKRRAKDQLQTQPEPKPAIAWHRQQIVNQIPRNCFPIMGTIFGHVVKVFALFRDRNVIELHQKTVCTHHNQLLWLQTKNTPFSFSTA